jgi:uncharacterized protein (TIGR02246 family)
MDKERVVQDLADREAIRELVVRYAECVWLKDAAGAGELFAKDCVMDPGTGQILRGRDELVAAYTQAVAGNDFMPFVSNHQVELHGERAGGTCRLDLRATMNGTAMIGAGRYEDEYVRLDGEWRFASRRLRMAFLVPIKAAWAGK